MSTDTQYRSVQFKFASRGVVASYATDSAPPDTYLNLANWEEREEQSISSRMGCMIIMRDPTGTQGGKNYLLGAPIHTITRLKYGTQTWRYAGSGQALYRRSGDTQGQYDQIYSTLSGNPFGSVTNTCFQSALDYLFIADTQALLKDSGAGTPSRWGILPPNLSANAIPFAPHVLVIDDFDGSLTYETVDMDWSAGTVGMVSVGAGYAVQDFFRYSVASGLTTAFEGALAKGGSASAVLFSLTGTPDPNALSAAAVQGNTLVGSEGNFVLNSFTGNVSASTTASVGRTINVDLDQNGTATDDDLICLCMQLSDPSAISEIKLMFDVNGSGYSSSYYYKSIAPAGYQSGVSGTTDGVQAVANEILADTLGLYSGSESSSSTSQLVTQLQASATNTGNNAWSRLLIRRGDLVPVGNAGQAGLSWADITGWQVEITTQTDSSLQISLNGLYFQWGSGPSSFGGTGYDYRYTYENLATATESNGSQAQEWNTTYGGAASRSPLIVLRQAVAVLGAYSPDPQVSVVNIYRRGGSLNQNWSYLDQIKNVPGNATFVYKDVIPDAAILQSDALQLDNDPPLTSSLQVPINTTMSAAYNPGTDLYKVFAPVQISTSDQSSFVVGQILQIGTTQNLEEVRVVTGGVGTFTAALRLQHAAQEPVQAFSLPAQPCDLCEVAYTKTWLAGDPNNPSFLYYSKPNYPETFPPQNYIRVGTPDSNIMAIINWRGTLFVATESTWFQIIDGSPPYAQPTGSAHGLAAKRGWCFAEGSIWYTALDGFREFRGGDGAYRTLAVEWLFQQPNETPKSPIPFVNISKLSTCVMAYHNNRVYAIYPGVDGANHRLIFDLRANARIRNDNVNGTAIYLERDTNTLLFGGRVGLGYAVVQDRVGDADDVGWSSGAVVSAAIAATAQIPFQDAGQPHSPKQWNSMELDADTGGQDVNVQLVLQNPDSVLNLGVINTSGRKKVDLVVNRGLGIEAYRCSVIFSGQFTTPPFLYKAEMSVAELAAYRNSHDTYWLKFGTNDLKLVKQGFFDYTANFPVSVALYADEDFGTPYFTFNLPVTSERSVVRVRFGNDDDVNSAKILRLFRMVATCGGTFRYWANPRIDYKGVTEGSSYAVAELTP